MTRIAAKEALSDLPPRSHGWRRVDIADLGFALALLVVVVFASLASDVFLTERNIVNLFRQMVTNGFLSLGQLLVILTGGIDLSVGSIVAVAGLLSTGLQAKMPFPAAIGCALLMGLVVGVINGAIIAKSKLQPFIVTLAMMGSLRGLGYIYSQTPQYPRDPAFRDLLGGGFIGPAPVSVIILLLCAPIVWFYLKYTTSGRAVFAMGVNQEAVRLAGISVNKHLIAAYAACGFLSAIGGVLLASRLGIAQPSVGIGYELDSIAAVVIGGGVLNGGGGTVIGVLGGVFALATIDDVLNLFNVESFYQQFVKGIIILAAVLARQGRRS
jgi:ribose transport system permease protein